MKKINFVLNVDILISIKILDRIILVYSVKC